MKLKNIVGLFLVSCFLFLTPSPVSAQLLPWQQINPDCVYDDPNSAVDDVATIQGIECVVSNILTVAITLIGLGVFAMLILGSFQFLTSGGDPKAAEGAKNTITYAILGLILAISAWFILNLIANFTGATSILQFSTQVTTP